MDRGGRLGAINPGEGFQREDVVGNIKAPAKCRNSVMKKEKVWRLLRICLSLADSLVHLIAESKILANVSPEELLIDNPRKFQAFFYREHGYHDPHATLGGLDIPMLVELNAGIQFRQVLLFRLRKPRFY